MSGESGDRAWERASARKTVLCQALARRGRSASETCASWASTPRISGRLGWSSSATISVVRLRAMAPPLTALRTSSALRGESVRGSRGFGMNGLPGSSFRTTPNAFGVASRMTPATTIDLHRAGDLFWTRAGWLDSRHSFSFGHHYDPANTHFGLLLVSNDDVVAPGTGFETHPHQDMEIVTWVLDGQLVHQDSTGHNGVIYPGLAQRMSAGSGILHSEKNDAWRLVPDAATDDPVHFVQMWVVPDEPRIDPGYEQLDIGAGLAGGGLVPVASVRGHDAAIGIRQKDAVLWASRIRSGDEVSLPEAPYVHLYVAKGAVTVEGAGALATGDAVRITGAEGQRVSAGDEGAEILVWEMHSSV